ncbi:MAG: hypothetical protein U0132_08940 [Gemmatimonadaceae bacterium]
MTHIHAHSRARRSIRRHSFAALVAAALTAAACGSDHSTGPASGPAGTYALQQVDGTTPPVEIHHGPWFDPVNHHFYNQLVVRVTHGTLDMDGTANFEMSFELSFVADGQPSQNTLTISGSYTKNGNDILLLPSTGGSIAATLQQRTVTIAIDFMEKGVALDYTFRR